MGGRRRNARREGAPGHVTSHRYLLLRRTGMNLGNRNALTSTATWKLPSAGQACGSLHPLHWKAFKLGRRKTAIERDWDGEAGVSLPGSRSCLVSTSAVSSHSSSLLSLSSRNPHSHPQQRTEILPSSLGNAPPLVPSSSPSASAIASLKKRRALIEDGENGCAGCLAYAET